MNFSAGFTILADKTSFWSLISTSVKASSAIENLILLLLIVCSIASWAIVFWKVYAIRNARAGNEAFRAKFEKAEDSSQLNANLPKASAPNILVYKAAMATLGERPKVKAASRSANGDALPINAAKGREELVQMRMEHASRDEFARLHRGMDLLASIASSTPFIGLFGTVLGIMSTFQVLGSAKSASLNVVAPGIAAALIATAGGLAVAIPAVFTYNWLMARIDELQEQSDMFVETMSQWLLSIGAVGRLPKSRSESHSASEPVIVGEGAHVPGATE